MSETPQTPSLSRVRWLHPAWMILSAVLLFLAGVVIHFWWQYRETQVLISDVNKLHGDFSLDYNAPPWLLKWLRARGLMPYCGWLLTDVKALSFGGDNVGDEWLQRI